MNVNKLIILEMIMIDHRYSDIKEFYACDDERCTIVNDIVQSVLNFAKHECEFQKFVSIELDNVCVNMNYDL